MPAHGMRVARVRRLRMAVLVGLAGIGLAFLAVQRRPPATDTAASTLQLVEPEQALAFTRALEPREFSFPWITALTSATRPNGGTTRGI